SALEMGEDRVDFSAMEPSVVKADPAHLRVAIRNLVRNALAYSSPDTEVKVRVNGKGQRVTVSVANRGPGIPAGEEEAIFDPIVPGRSGHASGGRRPFWRTGCRLRHARTARSGPVGPGPP